MDSAADTSKLQHRREYAREYYARRKLADPTYNTGNYRPRSEAQWAWHLNKLYGITPEQFAQTFEEQAGACTICGYTLFDTCHIDHCHASGKFRGLLCRGCNQGLGSFNDNPAALIAAAHYVEATV